MKREGTLTPLAERMRPQSFEQFYGQEHLLGPGKILAELIDSGRLVSLIFWGPPGSGKTTLARMLARHFDLPCLFFSAVLSGIKEVKDVMAKAESHKKMYGKPSIIFIDEIHRFNKAQQGAFLPYVERGDIILFGSTTENPSFEVISPLLSRTKVLVLNPLAEEAQSRILDEALRDKERGLGKLQLDLDVQARQLIIDQANGDARRALNTLEIAASLAHERIIGATATSMPPSTGWRGWFIRGRIHCTSPVGWFASLPRISAWPIPRLWPSPCAPRKLMIFWDHRKGNWPLPKP
jgi:putative ATPase